MGGRAVEVTREEALATDSSCPAECVVRQGEEDEEVPLGRTGRMLTAIATCCRCCWSVEEETAAAAMEADGGWQTVL